MVPFQGVNLPSLRVYIIGTLWKVLVYISNIINVARLERPQNEHEMNNKRIWSNLWMLLPTGLDTLWWWITSLGWITSFDVRWMFQKWDSDLDLLEKPVVPSSFPFHKNPPSLWFSIELLEGPVLSSKIPVKNHPFQAKSAEFSVGFRVSLTFDPQRSPQVQGMDSHEPGR